MEADCGVTVVTVVAGRHDHLRAQRAFLAAADPAPARHVVVAVADPGVAGVVAEQSGLPTTLICMERALGGLPVAAARNAGAAAALEAGAQMLIFLDVDCLPGRGLIRGYARAARARPHDVLCGPVTYLPPAPAAGWTQGELVRQRHPHPARPDPPPGTLAPGRPSQFWSLSFAVTAAAWRALPAFYEGYLGYGGEDTDFARGAARAGAGIVFVGGADAFHQHHPVSNPPVEHLDDIVRNSAVFAQRHGQLPMGGWLDGFAARGLITLVEGLPRRTDPIRVATIPARHPYLDAVLPTTVHRVSPDRVTGWEPDPLLIPEVLAARAAAIDVVHAHFGFDHVEEGQLTRWLAELRRARIPLVVTVHDLRNPHHESRHQHDAQLALLIQAAARVITLTDPAADECEQRFGRRPDVVAHPTVLAGVPAGPEPPRAAVLIPLKALRRNVREPLELVRAAAAGARRAGATARVLLGPQAMHRPEAAAIAQLAEAGHIQLDPRPYLPEGELAGLVAGARACVLPYQFGTHSGWVELCRDLGTRVVAPDCGYYVSQWPEVISYRNNEADGLDLASLDDAVQAACRRPPPPRPDRTTRLAQRDGARAAHDALYRDVTGR